MSIYYNIKLGIVDMLNNKGRSLITMLGIILGTMSVIMVLALVQGGREYSLKFLEERGGVLQLSIEPKWSFNLEKQSEVAQKRLTLKDMRLIKQYFPALKYYSPIITKHIRLKYKGNIFFCRVKGVYPEYQNAENFFVGKGRFISKFDNQSAANVVVLGTKAKEALFGNEPALGKHISISNTNFTVVGVMENKELYFSGWQHNALEWMNRRTFIPLNTMVKKLYGEEPLSSIDFQVASTDLVKPTQERLSNFLCALRDGKEIFEVRANSDRLKEIEKQTNKSQIIFLVIGGISLIVGGIVITNVMLASVKERLREIGVRMAVGARRKDILMQFLVQTLLVSLIGGTIGVMLGLSLLKILGNFLQSPTAANLQMIVIALVLSLGVGLIAGIFPAIDASRSDPIKILRYE
jgi:putative ABC transport system permease protein